VVVKLRPLYQCGDGRLNFTYSCFKVLNQDIDFLNHTIASSNAEIGLQTRANEREVYIDEETEEDDDEAMEVAP